jgi:hypothetical protein
MCFWLKNGLIGFVILTGIWGAVVIAFDIAIEATTGNQFTISWQTQTVSLHNPVIPFAINFVVGGLMVHFFKIRTMGWFEAGQPIHYALIGLLMGAVAVALTWEQRGGNLTQP